MTAVHGEPRTANTGQGWTVDDSTFGARLALVRQRMQWNIKEAARECGLPAATWGSWEKDGAMPRRYTETCKLIAARTGASYLWLLDGPQSTASDSVRNPLVSEWPTFTTPVPRQRPPGRTDSRRPGPGRRTARLPRDGGAGRP